MAFTARLKPELEEAARKLAESMGVSLMALVSVALSEYVDRRTGLSEVPSPLPPIPSDALSSPPAISGQVKGPKPKPARKVKHRSGAALFQRERNSRFVANLARPSPESDSEPDGEGFD
jgi:hypothetical protein